MWATGAAPAATSRQNRCVALQKHLRGSENPCNALQCLCESTVILERLVLSRMRLASHQVRPASLRAIAAARKDYLRQRRHPAASNVKNLLGAMRARQGREMLGREVVEEGMGAGLLWEEETGEGGVNINICAHLCTLLQAATPK